MNIKSTKTVVMQPHNCISIEDVNKPLYIHFDTDSQMFTVAFKYNGTRFSFDEMWNLLYDNAKSAVEKYEKLQEENIKLVRKLEEIQNTLAKLSIQ